MKRITRDRRLTTDEAAKYRAIRDQVAGELPDLIARHHQRLATLDQLQELFAQLKAEREANGLSLSDLTEITGMDRSALSKLETGGSAQTRQWKLSSAMPKRWASASCFRWPTPDPEPGPSHRRVATWHSWSPPCIPSRSPALLRSSRP